MRLEPKKALFKLLDLIFIVRPVLLPPVWTILLLGHFASRNTQTELSRGFFKGFLAMSFFAGGSYILNQLVDLKNDRENKKRLPLADGFVLKKTGFILLLTLYAAALILSWDINKLSFMYIILAVLLSILYNLPPFSLKDHPLGGLLLNCMGHGYVAYAFGYSLGLKSASITQLFPTIVYGLPYAFAIGAIYLGTTLADRSVDMGQDKRTLAVVLGVKGTIKLMSLLILLTLVTLPFSEKSEPMLCATLLSLPFFIWLLVKPSDSVIHYSFRVPVFILTLIVAWYYHFYIFLLLGVWLLSRIYYKERYQVIYPRFGDARQQV